jgi:hypothetical protein
VKNPSQLKIKQGQIHVDFFEEKKSNQNKAALIIIFLKKMDQLG